MSDRPDRPDVIARWRWTRTPPAAGGRYDYVPDPSTPAVPASDVEALRAELAEVRADWMLERLIESLRHAALLEGGPYFMGWPERWHDSFLRRCENGHVSSMTLKMSGVGDRCLGCEDRGPHSGRVVMTFPEDVDGVLDMPEQIVERWREARAAAGVTDAE